jgi:putative peptide zinc metalloprotease protein
MLVGAMGIMVELLLAAIALFVWLNADYGLVRSIAYNTMLIGGISTVFFNGNPLLRFDGYYVFSDLIGIPNLGKRSNAYLGYLTQRYLFGEKSATSPAENPTERKWFVFYGIASFLYRMFIVFTIILFIAGKFFFIGVLLAIWAVFTMLVVPVAKMLKFLVSSPKLQRRRPRAIAVSIVLTAAVVALLSLVPAPLWTRAEGVLWLPEQSLVRAGTDCFARELLAEPNTEVRPGDPLIACEDPLLRSRAKVLEARLEELEALYASQWREERVAAKVTREEIRTVEGDLADVRERLDELRFRSPAAGRFVVPKAEDLPGRFLRKGETVAYVLHPDALTIRAAVPQSDIGLVRARTQEVEVRLANQLENVYRVSVAREVPGGSDRLPSAVLSKAGGGVFDIDPRDEQGNKTFERIFEYDLRLPEAAQRSPVGTRAYVRFDHGTEPLARQWYRSLRQVFLGRFGV